MYNFIVNPETGRRVNVNGKIGRKVLTNYLNQLGGSSVSKPIGQRITDAIEDTPGMDYYKFGFIWADMDENPEKYKNMPKKEREVLLQKKKRWEDSKRAHKKRQKKSKKHSVNKVWVGEDGDIRENSEGPVIGWATVDGSMFGDFLSFKENKMQKDPRYN